MDEVLASWIAMAKVVRAIRMQDVKVMCK
uniref:Transposase n=1 Tax=Heterorhabditis bacteriophora TaxID=37862 RepID=A0A1I7X0Z6_HETBA